MIYVSVICLLVSIYFFVRLMKNQMQRKVNITVAIFSLLLTLVFIGVHIFSQQRDAAPNVQDGNVSIVASSEQSKQAYVQQLKSIGVMNLLSGIADYGISLDAIHANNSEEIQSVTRANQVYLPRSKMALGKLLDLKVPDEYKQFHILLQDTLGEFAGCMEETDKHIANLGEKEHYSKAESLYKSSSETALKLTKLSLFHELQ